MPKFYYWLKTKDDFSDDHTISFDSFKIELKFEPLKYWKLRFHVDWFPSCKEIYLPGFRLIIQKQYRQ